MPTGLKRYSGHDYLHFLTCSNNVVIRPLGTLLYCPIGRRSFGNVSIVEIDAINLVGQIYREPFALTASYSLFLVARQNIYIDS
jgi:hypothetical protein